jgi:hypothetical protein
MRGLMGSFAMMPLQDLVEFLARRRATGTLTCERGTVRKAVQMRAGDAVGAASNDPREFLGQLLINFGHISEEQLAKAFQTQEETKVRLGKVLVMVGLASPQTIREVLAIKIRETLLDAFVWDSGVFHVDDVPPETADELDVAIPLVDIGREAEFRATAWEAFRAQFPSGAATLILDESKLPKEISEESVDGRLIMLAIEGKTIDEIGLALHATDFHLYQRLYALAKQGWLTSAIIGTAPARPHVEMVAANDLVAQARVHLGAGRWEEAETAAARAVDLSPPLEVARSLLADAQRGLAQQLRARLLEPPRVPALRLRSHEVGLLRLSSAEKYLLSRCDGTRDLRRIAQVAPLRELEVLKAFKKFVDGQIVELV